MRTVRARLNGNPFPHHQPLFGKQKYHFVENPFSVTILVKVGVWKTNNQKVPFSRKYHFQISCVSNRTKTSGIPRFLQKYHFGESLCMLSSSTKITILSTKLPFSITIFNLPFCSVSTNKFLFQKYHFVELPFSRARTVDRFGDPGATGGSLRYCDMPGSSCQVSQ